MKSWRAESFGKVEEVLRLRDVSLPKPPPGYLALKVTAAGVGLPDLLMIGGAYPLVTSPPVSPGMEVAGEVIAAGEGCRFAVGDRVMAISGCREGWGGFSEQCWAADEMACRISSSMTDMEAAGFLIPYRTAYTGLVQRMRVQAGESLVVLGGAGSSGAAAIQFGKALGAKVIAVAGSTSKLDFCARMGANFLVNHRTEDPVQRINAITEGKGADAVFDPVGGELCERMIGCLARHGRIGLVGYAGGRWPVFNQVEIVLKNCSVVGVFAGNLSAEEFKERDRKLLEFADAGLIRTPVSRIFSFDEVPLVMNALEQSDQPGKLVVRVGGHSV